MAGLADLVLAGRGAADDDFDLGLGDPELERELQELRARREQLESRGRAGGDGEGSRPGSAASVLHSDDADGAAGAAAGSGGAGGAGASSSSSAGYPHPASGPGTAGGGGAEGSDGAEGGEASPAPPGNPSASGKRSLADTILARRGGGSIEQELASMEEELQRNLAEYRSHQRPEDKLPPQSSGALPAPDGAVADASPASSLENFRTSGGKAKASNTLGATLGATFGGAASGGAGGGGKNTLAATLGLGAAARGGGGAAASAGAGAGVVQGAGDGEEEVPAELAALKGEAAVMEEAFPERPGADGADGTEGADGGGDGGDGAAPARQRRVRTFELRPRGDAVPMDSGVLEMKGALEDIDVRLRAISSRSAALAPEFERPASAAGGGGGGDGEGAADEAMSTAAAGPPRSSEAGRAISELRAQNEALRKAMGEATTSKGAKGLLNFDKALFSAAGAAAAATSASRAVAEA